MSREASWRVPPRKKLVQREESRGTMSREASKRVPTREKAVQWEAYRGTLSREARKRVPIRENVVQREAYRGTKSREAGLRDPRRSQTSAQSRKAAPQIRRAVPQIREKKEKPRCGIQKNRQASGRDSRRMPAKMKNKRRCMDERNKLRGVYVFCLR